MQLISTATEGTRAIIQLIVENENETLNMLFIKECNVIVMTKNGKNCTTQSCGIMNECL